MDPDKIKAFLAEYRDLVHRHGLGVGGGEDGGQSPDGLRVIAVTDPDVHVAMIADERPSETKAKGKGK